MTYAQFQSQRLQTLREQPTILDCSEMNLYASLARLVPVAPTTPSARVHRCDLALEWTELFGLPGNCAERAFISNGVRDSLARLFGCYARRGHSAWIPADCYPVFQDLANANKLEFREYVTFPRSVWPGDDGIPGPNILLAMNPLKPAGRWLTEQDVSALMRWLATNPSRRLLLDCVYTFGTRFHESTMELVRGGQTILLHSLTKGWLRPRIFGVALVPLRDVEMLAPVFRRASPSASNLAEARFLMSACRELPDKVASAIEAANRTLRSNILAKYDAVEMSNSVGYFHAIHRRWSRMLAEGILGIPSAVFGSECSDITILSSLGLDG